MYVYQIKDKWTSIKLNLLSFAPPYSTTDKMEFCTTSFAMTPLEICNNFPSGWQSLSKGFVILASIWLNSYWRCCSSCFIAAGWVCSWSAYPVGLKPLLSFMALAYSPSIPWVRVQHKRADSFLVRPMMPPSLFALFITMDSVPISLNMRLNDPTVLLIVNWPSSKLLCTSWSSCVISSR